MDKIKRFFKFSKNQEKTSPDFTIEKINTDVIEDSTPITNNSNILKWIVDNQVECYQNKKKNLTSNLLLELEDLFGKCNKSLRLEFNTKVWVLSYDDLIFNLFTAKGKGTSIEVCNLSFDQIRNGEKQEKIINFLEKLTYLINN